MSCRRAVAVAALCGWLAACGSSPPPAESARSTSAESVESSPPGATGPVPDRAARVAEAIRPIDASGFTEEAQFVDAIRRQPWNARAIEQFADWLEPRDEPRARLVRLELQRARLDRQAAESERLKLQSAIDALRIEHGRKWTGGLGKLGRPTIRLGLVDELWMERATDGMVARLAGFPSLRGLRLKYPMLSPAGYESLATLPSLDFVEIITPDLGADALAALEKLHPRTYLRLCTRDTSAGRYEWTRGGNAVREMNDRRVRRAAAYSPAERYEAGARFLTAASFNDRPFGRPMSEVVPDIVTEIGDAEMLLIGGVIDLRSVSILDSPITTQGLAHLADCVGIEALRLQDTEIDSLRPLGRLVRLRELAFRSWDVRLDPAGFDALSQLTALEELSLSPGRPGRTGELVVRRLAGLKRLRTLEIGLGAVGIDDETSLESLKGLVNLTSLSLHGTGTVSDRVLTHLAGMRSLEHLDLDLNIEGGDGSGFDILARLPALRLVRLRGNGVTDRAVARLAPLRRVEELDLRDSRVTRAGAEALAARLPRVLALLDTAAVKTPREQYVFRRRRLGEHVSLLLPTHWTDSTTPERARFLVFEDGWKKPRGSFSKDLGPSYVHGWLDGRSKTLEEAIGLIGHRAASTRQPLPANLSAVPKDEAMAVIHDTADSNRHRTIAVRTPEGIAVIDFLTHPARSDELRPLFDYMIHSIRVSPKAEDHADETVEVLAKELK